jgi:excisionase family DNA binding protein
MIGLTNIDPDIRDQVGPWFLLGPGDQRTPISVRPPLVYEHRNEFRSTDVHFGYFKIPPGMQRNATVHDYFQYAVMEALRSAAAATPVDNEFWSVLFPSRPGNAAPGVVRMTYISESGRQSCRPQLAFFVLPDEAPALQLVFSARRTFVPASLKGMSKDILGPPSRLHALSNTLPKLGAIPLSALKAPLTLPASKPELPHIGAFRRLRESLPITDDELADIVGVGRTTPYKWIREGVSPKPKTRRLIMQIDAIVRGLHAVQGQAQFNEWFVVGMPSPLQLLRDGAIDIFERRAHATIFKPPTVRPTGYQLEDTPLPQRPVSAPSIAPRRAKVSLTKRDR